jgi:hypothetical protein
VLVGSSWCLEGWWWWDMCTTPYVVYYWAYGSRLLAVHWMRDVHGTREIYKGTATTEPLGVLQQASFTLSLPPLFTIVKSCF